MISPSPPVSLVSKVSSLLPQKRVMAIGFSITGDFKIFFQKHLTNFLKTCYDYDRLKKQGTVVQLVRAPPCHGGSCGFEPRQSRQATNMKHHNVC